jgi:predicted aldo/keto reductase-like oxidoreductase
MSGGFWDKARTRKVNTRAALKWALQNHNIHTSIPGCTAFEEVEDNLRIMHDITLTPEERNDLEDKEPSAGLFCKGCRRCVAQCPRVLPIPDMMRAYMYAYGYRDLALAREVVDQAGIEANPCKYCDSCKVRCSMGFDVARKISDISRIKEIPVDFIV